MKDILKSLIYFFIAVVIPGNLVAQTTNESATITASATVLSGLTITKEADVSFGNISATTPDVVRLSPDGSASAFVGNAANVGKLAIHSANNAELLINYPAGVVLETDTYEQLYYHIHVFGNTDNNQMEGSQLTNEGVAGNNVQISANEEGDYFLFIGGVLGGSVFGSPMKLSNQPTGSYTGEVVFEVKYN